MARYPWTQEQVDFVYERRNDTPPTPWAEIASLMETTFSVFRNGEAVRKYIKNVADNKRPSAPDPNEDLREQRVHDPEKGTTYVGANRPYSEEEMAEMFGINTAWWQVTKRISNVWHRFFQTKLWWDRIPMAETVDRWGEFLKEVRKQAPRWGSVHAPDLSTLDVMYELNLSDAHLGMLAWGPETGGDYDLYIGVDRYLAGLMYLLQNGPKNVGRYLLVLGQDLAHFDALIDGKVPATAAGTPQDVDTRWQKLYVAICDMFVNIIEELAENAKVDIVVQPGNHDTRTSFYIGQYLNAWFHDHPNVRIDNTPKPRKYVQHGINLIGFTHGKEEQNKQLGNIMADEAPDEWASSYVREWHLGHFHHEKVFQSGATTVRVMRALTSRDSWHVVKGYLNIPGAHGFVWHREHGLIEQVYYTVPKHQVRTDHLGAILKS